MSFIEGVGDEVVVFSVILLVLILAATITFLLNSSPFTEVQTVSLHPIESSPLSHELQQSDSDGTSEDSRTVNDVDVNPVPSPDEIEEELTHEVEDIQTNDNEVTSENNQTTFNSQIYPNINDCVSPTAPEVEPEETSIENETQSSNPEEIHVRLKYLDDTERTVISHPSIKIGDFKRAHFVEDIENNKIVRLIFGGQLLQENATLQSYGVANNCVIHVQILPAQTLHNPSSISQNTDLDLSHLLWPLLSVILGICWILYLKYPEFFNFMSLGMLLLFTGSFLYFYFQIQHQ